MNKLILTLSVAASMSVIQGCTVTISSAESAAHSHPPVGIEGPQGVEGKAGINKPKTSAGHTLPHKNSGANVQSKVGHSGATGLQGVAAPASVVIAPKKDSGLDARFLLDTFKAVVLGCIQYKC